MRHGWLQALALAAGLLAGCDRQEETAPPEPPQVSVMPPVRREITDWDEFTGRFASTERIELRARVSGYLDAVSFADGQVVQQGDLLFRIDPRPFRATVTEAEARLVGVRSQLALAERELERARSLLQYRAGSEANLEQRSQAVEAARAGVSGAEAALQRARLELEFTEIRAPLTGRIGRHLVSPGNLVSGGEASSATLLATIVTMDPIDVVFDIDQGAALRYTRMAETGGRPSSRDVANPVQLALADEADFPHPGKVVFVDNEADPGTGTIRLRARFDNKQDRFSPGVFARLRLVASLPYQALLVPDAAVATDQSRRVVYVLGPQNVLLARPVTLGPLEGGLRVIRAGLEGDEQVVVNGLMQARAGLAVRPMPAPASPAPASPTPASPTPGGAAREARP
ncbi:efflux RND transporter periplasmic adaptor subunit [Roseicella frigidaeris]|uniref:Efflux transporter periplasmic adaptor subunit n=1 Tax=Roseicella frigidaeris TaxID=2230885 RepID=A0A327M860_9PROT|nr:efflux RND transporter periplasmic adaptor subunit [Roseicella frigidaeris]RAI58484.1 efflux transporter periplasmic adaptor subunit [Roseicella frigidaeris]